jgi:hypothetical protein
MPRKKITIYTLAPAFFRELASEFKVARDILSPRPVYSLVFLEGDEVDAILGQLKLADGGADTSRSWSSGMTKLVDQTGQAKALLLVEIEEDKPLPEPGDDQADDNEGDDLDGYCKVMEIERRWEDHTVEGLVTGMRRQGYALRAATETRLYFTKIGMG